MNKKIFLLIAGAPGTGKTFLGNEIQKKIAGFHNISLDQIKEQVYDEKGFADLTEKRLLDQLALQRYFRQIASLMQTGQSILSDYPFSYKQGPELARLCRKYNYKPITIRLDADTDILYERQKKRDLDPSRHLGHLMNHYHRGDTLEDRNKADGMPSKEIFEARLKERGYNQFRLGKLFVQNVNDYSKMNYTDLISELTVMVNEMAKAGGDRLSVSKRKNNQYHNTI
jgi:adenylate kinase family enzyme